MSILGQIVTAIGLVIEIIALRKAWDKLPSDVSIKVENAGGNWTSENTRRIGKALYVKKSFKKEARLIAISLIVQIVGVFL